MTLENFLKQLKQHPETISFNDTMTVIEQNYTYQPAEFKNGLDSDVLSNAAGSNEGSCKIFAFAKLNDLPKELTLHLFGDYYRQDVLQNPDADNHQNIRHFMRYGWEGIEFSEMPLRKS